MTADDQPQPDDAPETPAEETPEQTSAERADDEGKANDLPPEVKAALRKANKEAETLRRRLKEIEDRDKTETERLNERTTAAEKRAADAVTRIVKAEVKALAGSRLRDPSDAVRLLDLDSFEVDDDGNVEEAAVKAALDALLEAKPYLGIDTGRRRAAGDIDQGVRGKPADAGRITTKEQLQAMTPQQIVKAKKDGLIDYAAISGKP